MARKDNRIQRSFYVRKEDWELLRKVFPEHGTTTLMVATMFENAANSLRRRGILSFEQRALMNLSLTDFLKDISYGDTNGTTKL